MILRSDFKACVSYNCLANIASYAEALAFASESYCCIAENTNVQGTPLTLEPPHKIASQTTSLQNGQSRQHYTLKLSCRGTFASVIRQGLPTGTKNNCIPML